MRLPHTSHHPAYPAGTQNLMLLTAEHRGAAAQLCIELLYHTTRASPRKMLTETGLQGDEAPAEMITSVFFPSSGEPGDAQQVHTAELETRGSE